MTLQREITYTREQLNFPKRLDTYYDLFQDGTANHLQPLNRRMPVEIMTNAYSWDRDYLDLLPELRKGVEACVTPGVDRDGFCGPDGFTGDCATLETVAGFPMTPMSFLPADNTQARADLGLPVTWRSERHRLIVSEFFDIVFSNWHPTSLRAPAMSTSGFPGFSHVVSYKVAVGNNIIENIDDVLNRFANKDAKGLISNYGTVFCYNGGIRAQVDNKGKQRIVFSLDYARGVSTVADYADKSVTIPRPLGDQDYSNLGATRARFINGAGFAVNVIPQIVSAGTMKALFKLFPETFHHTSIEEVAKDLNTRADCCMTDVSDYDRTIGSFFFDEMYISMAKYWDPEVVNWFKQLVESPYYTRPLDADGKVGTMFGDPFSLTPQVKAGNRSGHAGTSLIAKIVKVGETLTVIDDIARDVLGNVKAYLKWEKPIAMKNNGDDEALAGPALAVAKYRSMRTARGPKGEISYGYLFIEIEKGQGFSGYYFGRNKDGVYPMRRALAMLEKIFVPERSIGSVFRKFWPIGLMARMVSVEHMPAHEEVSRVYRETWDNSEVGRRCGTWMSLVKKGLENLPDLGAGLSQADYEVLDDPDKLHHKYVEEDISPSVLALVAGKILSEDVTDVAKRFFRGNILNPFDFVKKIILP
jgi:hypothetical protein